MNKLLQGILSVIYPQTCPCCGKVMVAGENIMCLHCRLSLPVTNHHLNPSDNELRSKLNGLIPIEQAVAYFHYHRSSPHAKLIHQAKYHAQPLIAQHLAHEYAQLIIPSGFFNDIDAITPVPLNFWKHCRRGYNQSYYIAKGLSLATNLPIVDSLHAKRHSSQTQKSGVERRSTIVSKHIFSAKLNSLDNINHILLVDDIATTGATLYSCCTALANLKPNIRISVLTLASTRLL